MFNEYQKDSSGQLHAFLFVWFQMDYEKMK